MITEEITSLEKLLKVLTIEIEKKNQEFDGFFFSTKEIKLENTIGDNLTIPAKKPIIVETKNIFNYKTIIDNIKDKKRLLTALNLDPEKFHFVGIIRGILIDENRKKAINGKIQNFKFENVIVIYPDKELNFLGSPLIELKKEKESQREKKVEESQEKKESNNFVYLLKEMQNQIVEFKNKVTEELNNLRADVNKLKEDVGDIKKNFQRNNN